MIEPEKELLSTKAFLRISSHPRRNACLGISQKSAIMV